MDTLTSSFDKGKKSIKQNKEQHKLLQDQIEKQKDRVKLLNEMLDKAKEKYDANSTEVQKWEQAVNNATTDLNKLKTELDNLPSSLQLVADKMKDVGGGIKDFGDKVAGVGKDLTAKVTAPIVGLATAAVKTTADFDSEMSKVQAISGASADEFTNLRNKAIEMGDTTKFSAAESAQAFEYMAMAGWKSEDMMSGISGIMNLAAASGEELGTTSDIVTDALTAFGMSAKDSGRFADILAAASSNANTNVSLLGESFKYVAPVAGAMGYSAEDMAVALGLMANSGIKASQAGTALRSVITRMAKPTKESGEAMDALGLSLTDADGNMLSFADVMTQMRDSFSGLSLQTEAGQAALAELDAQFAEGSISEDEYAASVENLIGAENGAAAAEQARLAAMLAGKVGMSGLLAIVNASEGDYNALAAAIDNSSQSFAMLADGSVVPLNEALQSGQEIIAQYSGTAEAMAGSMLNNLSGDVTLLKSQLQTLAIQFGDILVPILRDTVVPALQGLVEKLRELTPEQKEQILKIAGIVAAVGPILVVIGSVISGIGSVITIIGALVAGIGAFIAAVTPVGAATIAIMVAVGAAITLLAANWDTIKAAIITGLQYLKQMWITLWTAIKTFVLTTMENIKTTIANAITNIRNTWNMGWNAAKTFVFTAFDSIKTGVQSRFERVFTAIKEIIEKIKKTFTDLIDQALKWGKELVEKLAEGIRSAIGAVGDAIGGVADKIREFVHFSKPDKGPLHYIDEWMPDMMHQLADGMTSNLSTVRNAANLVGGAIAGGINSGMPADIAVRRSISTDDIYSATSAAQADTADELRKLNNAISGGATNITVMLAGDAGRMLKVLSVENGRRSRATGYNSLSGVMT